MKEKLLQAYDFFQRNSKVVKIVFVTLIMLFVVYEVINILTTVDYNSLKENLNLTKSRKHSHYDYRWTDCSHPYAYL
ncbi:putative lysylphosphatidylglycerol synthetase [Listeria fleischmannii FSL S10-1203]|uniref:Putative lysylphosphatidylglycerol synthetase n=1 Tax=Listeria fleischmannii FSL S10-1203 TaxID=1265822 RepID=W7DWC9_9LIST|nr:putative lysylphosphatidylglycerol synthetase [Listeria fleischmannii FSL S10-1203]